MNKSQLQRLYQLSGMNSALVLGVHVFPYIKLNEIKFILLCTSRDVDNRAILQMLAQLNT
jgi:hypothetical protein